MATMNVLLVGSGSREHAIAWKLAQSPQVRRLSIAPGNAGTGALGANLACSATDIPRLLDAVRAHAIDFTVVGPETPLAAGIVDAFRRQGLAICGPTQAAARIESSKVFAKELMLRHGIPTAPFRVFSDSGEAKRYVESRPAPMVVKADGLAAGKGVTVCQTREEALNAVADAMERKVFGAAGERILIEECLTGREVSVFAFTDGVHIAPLVAACDYKRVFDGDRGPNTGGMGSYAPPEFWNAELADTVLRTIVQPTVRAMAEEGCPFQGVLYAGLMLTPQGPQVIEFNCRLGDPETQALMPRLKSDLLDIFLAIADGTLDRVAVEWRPEACVGVVLASRGYPGDYPRGVPVHGLDSARPDVVLFHAGTARRADGTVVTDGGRVLTVAALGETLGDARRKAYQGIQDIRFDGSQHRSDIAAIKAAGTRLQARES
jgi:phosphoribosylamine--glycine ligase